MSYIYYSLCIELYYQLPNGKTVYLTIEEYLDLTDADIQYLMSLDYGESILDPFKGSAVDKNQSEKFYDFDYLPTDDEGVNNIASDDQPFDDIIDLTGDLEM
jgi:hypothetical protein